VTGVPAGGPALGLALAFVNTHNLYTTPAEQLSLARLGEIAGQHGYSDFVSDLTEEDVNTLRTIRERLRPLFTAQSSAEKVSALNAVLRSEGTGVELGRGGRAGLRLIPVPRRDPVARFAVLVVDALATAMVTGDPARFRHCVADPCRCVYVDRTKAGRQRYCSTWCNDRVASAAYRRRQLAAAAAT
jgi:predicted RNA-binding Zn ribbon-like protein